VPKLKVRVLQSLPEKIIGLIGSKAAYPIFFQTRWGIHTFGVRFPIDVLILDSHYRVVRIKSYLPPNRLFFWPIIYNHVIELPTGEVDRLKIKIGEVVQLNLI
jgi:uncharacterized protein